MALEAGSVYAVLGGKFNPAGFAQFDAAMKRSVAQAGKTEATTASATGAMAKFGSVAKTGAAAGALALAAGLGKSIQVTANFDQAMSELQAVTKASAAEMKLMRDAALDLGAKTGVGAKQAAGALTELAKGGLSTKQTIGALSGTIALAQAGTMNLSDAAVAVADTLNIFKMRGEEAAHVADALATAAIATTADVSDFTLALANGAGTAKTAGFTFNETVGWLEAIALSGIKGSEAGTTLKSALLQVVQVSRNGKGEAKALARSFFDQNGNMKSLSQISGILQDKLRGMSRENKLALLSQTAGAYGLKGLLALYEQGPKKVDALIRGLEAQGTAQDVATGKMDNLKGASQRLSAQLETIGIKVGTKLMPYLKTAADEVVRFLDSLNRGDLTATGFGRFIQQMAATAAPLVGVFLAVAKASAFMIGVLAKNPLTKAYFAPLAESANIGVKNLESVQRGLESLADMKPTARVKVDARDAIGQLNAIRNTKIRDKAIRIVASDESAKAKLRALIALGIPEKKARVMVRGAEEARQQVSLLRGELGGLSDKTVTVTYNERKIQQLGRRAAGRGAGMAEAALVGEGGGPEYVGNPSKGFRRVDGPTIMGLTASDYVIPTEPKYRGRALALMADALGIPAFKGGKVGKKEKARRDAFDQRLQLLGTSVDTASNDMATAESRRDEKAWQRARNRRLSALEKERRRIVKELGRLKKGSPRYVEMKNRLSSVRSEIASTRNDVFDPSELRGVTLRSRQLEELNARLEIARATLDDPATAVNETTVAVGDALERKRRFLQDLFDKASRSPARYGGLTAVGQIASDLRSTREEIAGLTGGSPGDVSGDAQAQADQAYQRGLAAGQSSFIDRLTSATIQGSPTLVFQSYVPPSPSEARRLADYTVGGIGYQGSRPSSSERIGA